MQISHVEVDPGPSDLRLVLHVRSLPRTAQDWEDACVDVGRVLVPLLGEGPLTTTIERAVPDRSDQLLVGPLPLPLPSGPALPPGEGIHLGRLPRRVVRLAVATTPGDVHGLPARLDIAPAADVGAGDVALRELLPPWWCLVEPPSGALGSPGQDFPREEWTRLTASRTVRHRLSVAADPAAPADLLVTLAGDPSATVRRAVAANRNAPEAALALLVADPQRRVRETLVENEALPPALLVRLLDDEAWQVRWDVVENPAADGDVLRAAAGHEDHVVRQMAAACPVLPADVTAALLHDGSKEVRAHLAACTVDPEALAVLVRDQQAEVRARATENSLLTEDQLAALAADRIAIVRECLAWRDDLPTELREQLARDRSQYVRSTLAHQAQPPSVTAILRKDAVEEIRWAAANQPRG